MAHSIWFKFILVFVFLMQGLCDKYKGGFSSGAEFCKNMDGKNIDLGNVNLGHIKSEDDEDGAGLMCLEGSLDINLKIDEGVKISLEIEKETDVGSEPMMSMLMDVCECLKDDDGPMKPIFAAMGISGCPIEAGTREVNELLVNLTFAESVLCDQYVGYYNALVEIVDPEMNTLCCYKLGMSIVRE